MVLVHHHRNMRKLIHSRFHHGPQEWRARIFARAGAGLHDHRGVGLVRSFHDGAGLLEIVDVEGRYAVAVFGGVVQQLSHTD